MSLQSVFKPELPTKPQQKLTWGNLQGSSGSLAIIQAVKQVPRLWVIVTADALSAQKLSSSLDFFNDSADPIPILLLPEWETLPYDQFSPHPDIISERLRTLYRISTLEQGILIVPITTLMHKIAPSAHTVGSSFVLSKGEQFDVEKMRIKLAACGYNCVAQVMQHGEFAVRGSIFDIFPMGSPYPYRIDLFDREVDSIRTFDPDTQRSLDKTEQIQLLPAREYPLNEQAVSLFRKQWYEAFAGKPIECPIYRDISEGNAAAGIEYYLPLFFESTATLFDYLGENSIFVRWQDIPLAAEKYLQDFKYRYEQLQYDKTRPLLPPARLLLSVEETFHKINEYAQIHVEKEPLTSGTGKTNYATESSASVDINHKSDAPLAKLQEFLDGREGSILFCAESAGRREVLLELLKDIHTTIKIYPSWRDFLNEKEMPIGILIGPLEEGLCLLDPKITLITEAQLFGEHVMQRRQRQHRAQDPNAIIRNLTELSIGAPVVHIDHGIGRYAGLQTISLGEQVNEFLTLEYLGNDKLYVPVSSLHLVSRYTGSDPELAPWHRLGSSQWEKAKQKAAEKVRDVAAELLEIYAKRAARQGHQYKAPGEEYHVFSRAFPFEETIDQLEAINSVIKDMTSTQPMDRLICGDVGFGKTEVAMRAAFIAASEGKQVAVLVPTTLLAQQHYDNFKDRFVETPINIEVLSRFKTKKEQEQVIEKLKHGGIDIIIGTHKIIQPDVKFKALGLVIIDEEHRFGVSQKERLKALRSEVDILTLTATPIPRTLNMAMAGIRDLSIIATPPAKRLSIKTFVRESNDALIKEAIQRETLRGGQVYFLHNKVETIYKRADEIQQLFPDARIAVGHGQMRERELEKVMADFYHQRYSILVCTTIIESGIDIPSANTIIIDRADCFGLAQLHQIRGRVGRSHHQAYAYLLTLPANLLNKDAQKRLDAIASLEDLGAGFTLATHDLEIRGTGELLGEEQSGHIQEIGFNLYTEMLEKAVKSLQNGEEFSLETSKTRTTTIDLHISALIPENYLADVHSRLILYKRIASASDQQELNDLKSELIDRFGVLPVASENLFFITKLKLMAEALGIEKIDANGATGRIYFYDKPKINHQAVISMIQSQPKVYAMEKGHILRFNCATAENKARLEFVEQLLFGLCPVENQ